MPNVQKSLNACVPIKAVDDIVGDIKGTISQNDRFNQCEGYSNEKGD